MNSTFAESAQAPRYSVKILSTGHPWDEDFTEPTWRKRHLCRNAGIRCFYEEFLCFGGGGADWFRPPHRPEDRLAEENTQTSKVRPERLYLTEGTMEKVRSKKGAKSVYDERFLLHYTPVGRNPIRIGVFSWREVTSNDWSRALDPRHMVAAI